MKKLTLCLLLALALALPALADGTVYELSPCMYGSLSAAADGIGGMEWDGEWTYANDITQAYIRDDVLLAGNAEDVVRLIAINDVCPYSLLGLQAGMDEVVLQPYMNLYPCQAYEDGATNYLFTLSEGEDGWVETLWVIASDGRISNIVYEAGYGHGM